MVGFGAANGENPAVAEQAGREWTQDRHAAASR
jgi:hypothetical protein